MRASFIYPLTAYGLCLVAFFVDQCIKYYVQNNIPLHSSVALHPLLTLTHTHNFGVTLSTFAQRSAAGQYAMIAVALCLLIALSIYVCTHTPCRRRRYGLALAWAGGLSNAVDRLLNGGVIDYLWFHVGDWHWPAIVNVADLCICLGCALLAWETQKTLKKT